MKEDHLLARLGDLAEDLTCFRVLRHGAQRHFDDAVLPHLAAALACAAALTVLGDHVLGVAQMQQRPQLGIGAQDDVAAATTVTTIRAAPGDVLLAPHVAAARATLAGAAFDLDLVDEVR